MNYARRVIAVIMLAGLGMLTTPVQASHNPANRAAICWSIPGNHGPQMFCNDWGHMLIYTGSYGYTVRVYFATTTRSHRVWVSPAAQFADSPDYYSLNRDVTDHVPAGYRGVYFPLAALIPTDSRGQLRPGTYRISVQVDGVDLMPLTFGITLQRIASGGGLCAHPHCKPNNAQP